MSPDAQQDRLVGFQWDNESLWAQFERRLKDSPKALALIDCADRAWSRQHLADLAAPMAKALREGGAGPGHRVLFPAERSAAALAAALAISETGAICCPHPSGVSAADFRKLSGSLGHTMRIDLTTDGGFALEAQPQASWSKDQRDHQAALIAFTSGSTGAPKAVIHRSEALNYVTRACAAIADLGADDPILGAIPMDGAAGFTFTIHMALSIGRPLVLIDRWQPDAVLDRAARFACTWTTLVPTQVFTLIEAARLNAWEDRLALRTIALGGSAMTPELIMEAEARLGVTALRMFGMSECLAHCSNQPDFPREKRLRTDGHPFPGTEVAAFDGEGRRLPNGQRGQAGVKGPSLFLGYSAGFGGGQEQLTAEGFYLTGDEILIDEAGFVKVVGRIKDQIIRGGYNIDPAEVEAVLLRRSAIAQVAIVAVPHDKLGEQACAVVRFAPGARALTLQDLLDHLTEAQVYRRKWPEHLVIVDAMQTLPSGKINKRAMTALAVAEIVSRTIG